MAPEEAMRAWGAGTLAGQRHDSKVLTVKRGPHTDDILAEEEVSQMYKIISN